MMRMGIWLGRLYAIIAIVFFLAPLVIVVILSFSSDDFVAFPPGGYSLRWYRALAADPDFVNAFLVSIRVAVLATGIAILIAFPTSVALTRRQFLGRDTLRAIVLSPLVLPEVLLGLALLNFIQGILGHRPSLALLIAGHTLIVLPFCVQFLSSSLSSLDSDLEEAARTLGSTPLNAFLRVALPLVLPAAASAGLLSFIFSFDNVAISLFLSVPGVTTLPVRMYEHATYTNDMTVAASSAVLVYIGLFFLVLISRFRVFGDIARTAR